MPCKTKLITIKEAIKQGYKYAIINDDEYCIPLMELTKENFKKNGYCKRSTIIFVYEEVHVDLWEINDHGLNI